jgi:hypothetical protein
VTGRPCDAWGTGTKTVALSNIHFMDGRFRPKIRCPLRPTLRAQRFHYERLELAEDAGFGNRWAPRSKGTTLREASWDLTTRTTQAIPVPVED